MPRNRPNSGHSRFATGLQHPTPNIPDMGKKQLAVAMTTMSVAALGGGIGAAGAQAQNDETLSGTATTSGGASGLCLSSSLLATAYSFRLLVRRDLLLASPDERRAIHAQARRMQTMGEVEVYARTVLIEIERWNRRRAQVATRA
jgi:hypothetical protein